MRSSPAPQVDGYLSSIPARAARISLSIHRGDVAGARHELARAMSLRPLLSAAGPGAAVLCLMAFARAHRAVDDPGGARALVTQARDVIRDRPDLGVLPAEVDALRATLATGAPRRGKGATASRSRSSASSASFPTTSRSRRSGTPRRQGDDGQVTGAGDLRQAGRGDPERRGRPRRRRGAPGALLADRSSPVSR